MVEPVNYLNIDGMRMHYIDQGVGDAVLLLHGNPSWSFFYRNLINSLSKTNRVIAPDHIGMGFSDKPQDADYHLAFHIENIERLVEHLRLKDIILVVHDWGGPIGFGYVVKHSEKIKKIVVLNSSAFFDAKIPRRISVCRGVLGRFLVRRLNLFAQAATRMTTTTKLTKEVRQAYLLPYGSYDERIGIDSFLQDIPLEQGHRTRALLDSIESRLPDIKADLLILWGKQDFCFTEHFFDRWKEYFPHAKTRLFENAGHYILEDVFEDALREIEEFIR
ncbi:MAG: alpha/beta fold hydrolase [Coriobacteriia bacterium]|nr:alpha/beta fold hydrolase [Coriobacteriia bacterium]